MQNRNISRQSNIELLRIISMIGIISLHYFNDDFGGVRNIIEFPETRWILSYGIICLAIPLVNCFVLITGYFSCNKRELSIGKIFELVLITTLYGTISYFIACIKGLSVFSVKGLIFAAIPFLEGRRWFVETYLILLLFSPFINIVIHECGKKSFTVLIEIQISLFCIWYSIGYSAPLLDDGYGIINFITLYSIGAYIRKYQQEIKLPRNWICILSYVLVCVITFVLNLRVNSLGYSFITNIVASIFVFVGFLNWRISVNRYINHISTYVFDIYFVHTDKILGKYLFQNILKSTSATLGVLSLGFHWMVTVIVIFSLGIIVGGMRKFLFEKVLYQRIGFDVIPNKKISIW